jgi:hypothetical protein
MREGEGENDMEEREREKGREKEKRSGSYRRDGRRGGREERARRREK